MAQKNMKDHMDRQIDENLRRVYADAANDPVPDRFAKLLAQLREKDEQDTSHAGKGAS
ncbi:MAG: RNA polymerase subunit sigma-70 [Loktanella sp.]|nr:RNA polymerase subunit sigma-70 [Loktanella sp.]